jgi:beta-galactosidase
VVRRGRYLFVLNRGPVAAVVRAHGVDLLSGRDVAESVIVSGGCAAVVRQDEA